MKENAKAILDSLVERISAETTVNFISDRLFTDGIDIPCQRWSTLNRFMVSLSGSIDARGIRQWNSVGRRVKKGASSLSILVPILIPLKKKEGKDKAEDGEEGRKLRGFKLMPVFRAEDTEGEPLPYEERMRSFHTEDLPLSDVATSLGVSVRAAILPGCSAVYRKRKKEILLGTDNPQTFLHELSHAVDHKLSADTQDYALGEVVAELSSCFLGSLYGVPVDVDSTKAYIEHYAGKGHVAFRIMEALDRVEAIYRFIEKSHRGVVRPKDSPQKKTARSVQNLLIA